MAMWSEPLFESDLCVSGARGMRGVTGVRCVRVAKGASHLVKLSLPNFFLNSLNSVKAI